jgi:hypothetical protein
LHLIVEELKKKSKPLKAKSAYVNLITNALSREFATKCRNYTTFCPHVQRKFGEKNTYVGQNGMK